MTDPYHVRKSASKHGGWEVWGPMGRPSFTGGKSWHATRREADSTARRLNRARK